MNCTVTGDAPQRSVLSPILFYILINYLDFCLDHTLTIFADEMLAAVVLVTFLPV